MAATATDGSTYTQAVYVNTISYGGNTNVSPSTLSPSSRQLVFHYSTRSDYTSYGGYYSQHYVLQALTSIDVNFNGGLVRRYVFSHTYAPWTYSPIDLGTNGYAGAVNTDGAVLHASLNTLPPGSISGTVSPNAVTGPVNRDTAPAFSGNGYIALSPPHGAWSQLSVEAWVRTDQTSPMAIVTTDGMGKNSQTFGYGLYLNTGALPGFWISNTSVTGSVSLADDRWHYLVGTFDGTTVALYVDGVQVAATTASSNTLNAPQTSALWVGAHATWGGSSCEGAIGEVAVYPSALSPSQVAGHWAAVIYDARTVSPQQGQSKLLLTSLVEYGSDGTSALPAWQFQYTQAPTNLLLQQVTSPYGGSVSYSYQGFTPLGWWGLSQRFRVSQVQTLPGTDAPNDMITSTYTYADSGWVAPGSLDFRGHAWTQVADAAGHFTRSHFYTLNTVSWQSASGSPSFAKTAADVLVLQGRCYATERWAAGASTWTTREETDWQYTVTAGASVGQGGAAFVAPAWQASWVHAAGGALLGRITANITYDAHGNRTQAQEIDQTGTLVRTRQWTYAPPGNTRYIADRLARAVVLDGQGTLAQETQSYYDGNTSSTAAVGQFGDRTAVRQTLDANRCVDLTYTYDTYGHPVSMTEYGSGAFLDDAVNVVAAGKPGVGKSHALAAIGHELVLQGHQVLWTPTAKLVQELLAAKRDLRLPQVLAKLDRFECVFLDDIGYVQHDRDEMEVLFTFLAERYERRSVAISTNLVFSDWNRIFKDPMTTMAAIDRVVHHSVILDLMGMDSFRAREAGDQHPPPQAEPEPSADPNNREQAA